MYKNDKNYIRLTDKNFQQEVKKNPLPILVIIEAEWCGACQIMVPVIEKISLDCRDSLRIGRLDIDTAGEIAEIYQSNELPIFLFYKNGQLIDRIIGAVPRNILLIKLKELLDKK